MWQDFVHFLKFVLVKVESIASWYVLVITEVRSLYLVRCISVVYENAAFWSEKVYARVPVLPVRIYSKNGNRMVHALIDIRSVETQISRDLYRQLGLNGTPLETVLVTPDGHRKLITTHSTSFKIIAFDIDIIFSINESLVMDDLPCLDNNFPTNENL